MCSILGYKGDKLSFEEINKLNEINVKRGPDATYSETVDDITLFFNRLSIMDLTDAGKQPFFYEKKWLICNGEIYGYKELKEGLKEGYEFTSDSDCEVILPLYKLYGFSMFSILGSEFALIMYDQKHHNLIAARDPIGIRPLYYANYKGGIIFASEPLTLISLNVPITPFPPGHYYSEGKFYQYTNITRVSKKNQDGIHLVLQNINTLLTNSVQERLTSDANVGFLLSGGLDSSLICSIASKILKKPIETYAIGMVNDAIDLKYAKEVAEFIHSNHHEVIVTKDDVLNILPEVIYNLGTYDTTTIRASLCMYLLCKYINTTSNIRVLLTGEISDELFGYKYTDYAPSAEEFQKESVKRIKELHYYDVLRSDRCVSNNSLEARVPFGDNKFVKYVLSINPELKMNTHNKGKYLLRQAFKDNYLPESILDREKAAFSDAVGHSMVDYLKEYANNKYSDEEYNKKIKTYKINPPYTKEMLLYREIYDSHYKNQKKLVIGFWMPNPNWVKDITDPSARFLNNYGDSGK